MKEKVSYILIIFIITFSFSLKQVVFAESSKEYAVIGNSAYKAFECSALAEKLKYIKEQERLFLFGYNQGLKFIDALKEKKIKQDDLSSEVPFIMLLLLQGPTPDFMLGRVFEGAIDSALRDILKTGDILNSDEVQESLAQNKFEKCNCKLIGK